MPDVYLNRREQMFPRLTPAQIERLGGCGQARRVAAGEVLFDSGDQNTEFFVVLQGAIELLRPAMAHDERIVTLGPGEFTGEINMLSGRRSLVQARVAEEGSIFVLEREGLLALVQKDSELSEILMRAFILRRMALISNSGSDLVLIGSSHSLATLDLKAFLTRNGQPFTYQDVESDPSVQALLDRFQVGIAEIPVILCRGGHLLRNPSVEALAPLLGLNRDIDATATRDVVIVGAGPAGLAAAVYAASEGLNVLVLETTAPGGQAGTSSRIENYLGFPTGISGQALAGRAFTQAEKFGAEVAIGRRAVRLHCEARPYRVELSSGEMVQARTVVIAAGAQYRRPALSELQRLEGAGVFYCATHVEAQMCAGEAVAVVGGGNSAGQAAVFLSQIAAHVDLLVRGPGLADSMSRYLISRIESSPKITLWTRTEIEGAEGGDRLEALRWRRLDGAEVVSRPVRHLFLMTGADPNTRWLEGCLVLDDKGFIKAGADLRPDELPAPRWPIGRTPSLMETSLPGVFAVGDVRSGSVKRVASAVGEGSICVQLIHRALRDQ